MIPAFSDSSGSIHDGRSKNETFRSLHLIPGGSHLAVTGDICRVCVVGGLGAGVVTGVGQVRPLMLLKVLQCTDAHAATPRAGVRSCSWARLMEKYSKSSLCWTIPSS